VSSRIFILAAGFLLSGFLGDLVFGAKPNVSYSSKPYSVRNGFGEHKYRPANRYRLNRKYTSGSASYYGGKFNGRKTASCVIFDETQLTAAHPTAVLPSIAKVTRLDNGRTVYVIITDRGPFAKNRICDLAVSAAHKLGMSRQGHARVKIQILEQNSRILAKHWHKFLHKKLPKEIFRHIHSAHSLQRYLNRIR